MSAALYGQGGSEVEKRPTATIWYGSSDNEEVEHKLKPGRSAFVLKCCTQLVLS